MTLEQSNKPNIKIGEMAKLAQVLESMANSNKQVQVKNIEEEIFTKMIFHFSAQISQFVFMVDNNKLVFVWPAIRTIFESIADFDFHREQRARTVGRHVCQGVGERDRRFRRHPS